jgi:uncharacterized protein (TIGR02996 family)
MNDRLALMAAIVANPAEDTPRLALADWLQEHGDEHDRARAEHIRLQIEYAPLKIGSVARGKLQRPAIKLQKRHAERWLGPLADYAFEHSAPDDEGLFERGLLQWWMQNAKHFVQKKIQKAVCEWFPRVGVNRLVLLGPTAPPKLVAASPALAWVPSFEWDQGMIDDAGLTALAASRHFARLGTFGLDGVKLTDRGLLAFADAGTMPNLRRVQLRSGGKAKYTAAGILAVVGSERLPRLCELDLDCDQPKSLDYKALFADARLGRLKGLQLGWKSDVGTAVRSPHLTGLEDLSANEITLTVEDIDALLANPALKNLKRLALDGVGSRLPPAPVKRLRDRFGTGLHFRYDISLS